MSDVVISRKRLSRSDRRKQILQTFVRMLEEGVGEKITTARLAKALDLSEAALYRCFENKAAMYDALIDFIEESVLGLFAQIKERKELSSLEKIRIMIKVMLDFSTYNPGLTSILTGTALVYEDPALTKRMKSIHSRFEASLKQEYREAILSNEVPGDFDAKVKASVLMSIVSGYWLRFVLSDFKEAPNVLGKNTLEKLVR